ncbi:PKD domain-containing protein [Reichenbachiella carrageenanivorans]|uniref:PKD domain-containing protein n=1 Tax=Reichenbachiella carrageenanivorans TaxID=2979869 RepID=A0ABY6CW66_9BACT|nr:PKD domain-containing protein [Reichenbachiella carrageenanivorans]UXX77949.1 PKD domain-containing protein [Reichenbachiella carrageenanivorans]
MKSLILLVRLMTLMILLTFLQSCDLDELLGKEEDPDFGKELPAKIQGSWYNASGVWLYEIGTDTEEGYYIQTEDVQYFYTEYDLTSGVYTVLAESLDGNEAQFYIIPGSESYIMAISQESPSSGLVTVWNDIELIGSGEVSGGGLPTTMYDGWYNANSIWLWSIQKSTPDNYVQTGNVKYYFEEADVSLSNEAYKVLGVSASGTARTFYFKHGANTSELQASTVSSTSGFETYWNAVSNIPLPHALFTASSGNIATGESVQFNDYASYAVKYLWTFEGGTPATSSDKNPKVTYNSAGEFKVSLKVTNYAGTHTEEKDNYIKVSASSVTRGFAWCGNPTSISYTPSTSYSYNSKGGAISVTRSTTGSYAVRFAGMSMSNAHVQASLYGDSEGAVRVLSWSNSGADLVVDVRTFDNEANLADRTFNIFVTGTGFEGAYLYASEESLGSYTPTTTKSYNSSGGSPTITSSSVGTYKVKIPGAGSSLGNVQVTAAGAVSAIAKVKEWSILGNDLIIEVRTYHSGTGALKDAEFNLLYTKNLTNVKGAYGYALYETATTAYTPSRTSNSATGTMYMRKIETGSYEVIVSNQAGSGNTILVTAHGNNNYKASVSSWSSYGADLKAYVNTYNSNGVLTDAEFTFFTIYQD